MVGVREHTAKTNGGLRVREVSLCLLCGKEGIRLYHCLRDGLFSAPGVWDAQRCPQCGFVWLDPCPISEDIGKAYRDYYTSGAKDGGKSRLSSLKKSLSNQVWTRYYGYRGLIKAGDNLWGRLLSWIPPVKEFLGLSIMGLDASLTGELLDIGSGKGEFLSNMRNIGWHVHGVEPDEQAVRFAKETFKIELHQGTVESVGFPESSFDVVTMNHVIEHVHDPIALLRECRRILKRGGRLVMLTPNVESFGHRLFKRFWRGLEPPRHLHLFSLKTIQICAKLTGLDVETLKTTTRSARGAWVGNWFMRKSKRYTNDDITWLLWVGGVIFQLCEEASRFFFRGAGEEIFIVAVKRDDIE